MIRRPPRSTLDRSSAASDVYKRQVLGRENAKGPQAGAVEFVDLVDDPAEMAADVGFGDPFDDPTDQADLTIAVLVVVLSLIHI